MWDADPISASSVSGSLSRRDLAGAFLAATVGLALPDRFIRRMASATHDPAPRISVRPTHARGKPPKPGTQPLAIASTGRDGWLHVPAGYQPQKPVPLVLALHGATQSGEGPVRRFGPLADRLGFAVVAPDSRGMTWDAIRGDFGIDVSFIGRALEAAWSRVEIDPTRLGLIGFSDGATYVLALGRANGDLFTALAAFSPGFLIPVSSTGRPPIFISHGTEDPILPIEQCSRRIVPELRRQGYQVNYREFPGGHTVPSEMAEAGLAIVTQR